METDLIGQAYHEGRGSITVRGKVRIEDDQAASRAASSDGSRPKAKATRKSGSGKPQIIITELPYQSNKVQCAFTYIFGRLGVTCGCQVSCSHG